MLADDLLGIDKYVREDRESLVASERGGRCKHAVQPGVASQRGELLTTPIVVADEVCLTDRLPVPDLRIGQVEHSVG